VSASKHYDFLHVSVGYGGKEVHQCLVNVLKRYPDAIGVAITKHLAKDLSLSGCEVI
jgi:hypothetical protein